MSVRKNAETNKQRLLTANGSFDTLIKQPNAEYSGISLTEIAAIVRENGEYWMLAIDVDTGSPSLTEITQAIRAAIGPAACLIYSSSSASMDERKWRALIPVAEFLTGEEYVDAQIAIFDLMQEQGITCDPALSRAGQPIYLPNVPPARRDATGQPEFYHCHLERGEGYLVVKESRVWAGVEFRRKQEQIAQAKAAQERERRQAERAAKRAERPNDVDPVAEFNDRHTSAICCTNTATNSTGGQTTTAARTNRLDHTQRKTLARIGCRCRSPTQPLASVRSSRAM